MRTKTKIALSVPRTDKAEWHFSFRLKHQLLDVQDEYTQTKKTLVVSDIEGNFHSLCNLLIKGGVIDKHLRWIFEDNRLVILGDCFDRGEQVIECLWLIYSLEERAERAGGRVHFILGNHEIMNLNGDWRYVHPKYAASSTIPYTALYGGNSELWHWLCTKNIIEKIGDVLFVHGGIAHEILAMNLLVAEINNLARPYYSRANEQLNDPVLYTILKSEKSPLWYRGFYQQGMTEDHIDATLKHFGVKTIVTGHTVMEKVTTFFNGKVINVDTDHASGNSEALLIRRNRFYRIDKDGKREKLK
jgi:hypothetical protein